MKWCMRFLRKLFDWLIAQSCKQYFEIPIETKCPICVIEPPKCPPNICPTLPKCPETTAAPTTLGDTGITLDGKDPPPAPYDKEDPNAPSGKHITYKRIYDFFTQAGTKPRLEEDLLLFKVELQAS